MPRGSRSIVKHAVLQSKGREAWHVELKTKRENEAAVYTLGRHVGCALVLADMHISSKHMSISCKRNNNGDVLFEVMDTSTNGTWVNGKKLDRCKPITVEDGHEISFPCDEPLQADYTFILSVLDASIGLECSNPNIKTDCEWTEDDEEERMDQWKDILREQNDLILNVSRVAASAYTNQDILNNLRQKEKITKTSDPVGPGLENSAQTKDEMSVTRNSIKLEDLEKGMNKLVQAQENTVKIAEKMLDTLKLTRSKLLLCDSISEKDRESIIKTLDLSRWEKVLEEIQE